MKLIYLFFTISIFSLNIAFAQNYHSGVITTNNGLVIKGRILIDNSSKTVTFKKNKDTNIYRFSTINSVTIKKINYTKIEVNDEVYLATMLISGKASFYEISENSFIIINENNAQIFNLIEDKHQIPGILSLLFKDCNSVRDQINETAEFSKNNLITLIKLYNNCAYGVFQPTEKEIERANIHNTDIYRINVSLQGSFSNTSVNNYDSNSTNGFGFGVGIASSPNFMGKLKGNIFLDMDFYTNFTENNNFNNGNTSLNYKVNSYRLGLGLEYFFNKKGKLLPFLGVGLGYISNYYNGTIGAIDFKDNIQSFFYSPKIGILYHLKNDNHLGLTINYIPEYTNNLSFKFEETYNPLVIKNSFATIGLSYHF